MRHYLTDRNLRRAFVLAVFLGLLFFFRHLLLLFALFVVFERALALAAGFLSARTRVRFPIAVLLVVLALLGAIVGAAWWGVDAVLSRLPMLRGEFADVLARIDASPRLAHYRDVLTHVGGDAALEQGRHHALDALRFAESIGRHALHVAIALIFAVVFLLERPQLAAWRERMAVDSVPRILLRYLGYAADAVAITVKLQVIVAVVNTLITLPVLLVLRLPGIPALLALLLVTGLIPVVGGPVAGAVLMTLAYVTRGVLGLSVFVVSTFVLHKIESYYLNPRLTARHVNLPGFIIIVSLVLFEHAFGLIGLFLSFPALYVAAKIRESWVDPADEARDDEIETRELRGESPAVAIASTEHRPRH